MSESRRGFYIVATLGAIVGFGLIAGPESRCQREQDASRAQASGRPGDYKEYQFGSERAWMPCIVERAISNPPSHNGTDSEQRDLIAQESAALWGFWIAVFALFQLIATIIGLILIKRTLDATWGAVTEAREATKAAQATANAYVAVERARLVPVVGGCWLDTKTLRIQVSVEAENIGKSTAYVERFGLVTSANNGPPEPMVLRPVGHSINAGESKWVGRAESEQDFHTFRYVKGAVVYRSAFKEDHMTYFCFRIEEAPYNDYGEGGPYAVRDRGAHWPEDT